MYIHIQLDGGSGGARCVVLSMRQGLGRVFANAGCGRHLKLIGGDACVLGGAWERKETRTSGRDKDLGGDSLSQHGSQVDWVNLSQEST